MKKIILIPIFAITMIQTNQAQDLKSVPTLDNPFFKDYTTQIIIIKDISLKL